MCPDDGLNFWSIENLAIIDFPNKQLQQYVTVSSYLVWQIIIQVGDNSSYLAWTEIIKLSTNFRGHSFN